MYFRVTLVGGRVLTVFQDLIAGDWYLQTTATPRAGAKPVDVLAPRVPVQRQAAAPAEPAADAAPTPIRRIGTR
jgi:hypothetical protein